ncbi:MAG: ATP-binding cassette domain-containing protein, partial [Actinomycetota bacterium]|nr:ATP-binding cassette domain-containing protein [Actinomycetota bacterium]
MNALAEGTTEAKKGRIVARGLSHAFDAPARAARASGDGERRSPVLKDVDLGVCAGEFFCIVGGSGCGKTTLLRVLAGLLRPEAGEVSVGGRTVEGPMPEVGFLFQQPVLLEWRTVLDNVLLPLEVGHGGSDRGSWRGRKSSEAKRARALELLAGVGLEGYEHHRPDQLSGGMQQRVALAR